MMQATRDIINNLSSTQGDFQAELDRLRKEISQVQGLFNKLAQATGYNVVYKPALSSQAHYELVKIVPPTPPEVPGKGKGKKNAKV